MAESHRDEIAKLETLYANNPEGRLFTHLAEAYRKAGELDRAREVLEGGLTRHPDYSSAYVVLGRVMQDLADPAAAGEAFRRVLDLDPENRVAVRALGDIAREAGRTEEALDYYRQLRQLDPSDEELRETISALAGGSSEAASAAVETAGEAAAETGEGVPQPDRPDAELSAGAAEAAADWEQAATDAEERTAQESEVVTGAEDLAAGAEERGPVADRSDWPDVAERIEGLELGPRVESSGGLEQVVESQPVEGLEPAQDSGPRPDRAAEGGDALEGTPAAEHEPLDIGEQAFSFDPDAWRDVQEPTDAAGELSLEDLSLAGTAGGGVEEGAAAPGATEDGGLVDLGGDSLREAEAEAEEVTAEAAPGEPIPQPALEAGTAPAPQPPDAESGARVEEPSEAAMEFGEGEDLSWAEALADEEAGEAADVVEAAASFLTWDSGAGNAAADDAEAVGGGAEDASGWSWDEESAEEESAPAMTTETMAELYRVQGLYGRAADIYRSLLRERPDDERLRAQLEAVEREMHGRFMPPHTGPAPAQAEEAGGEVGADDQGAESTTPWTDAHPASEAETTPYAWEGPQEEEEGVSIGVYLTGLLAWRRDDSGRASEVRAAEPSADVETAELEEETAWPAYGEEEAETSPFGAGAEAAEAMEAPEPDDDDGAGWTPYGIDSEVEPPGDEGAAEAALGQDEADDAEDLSWLFGSEEEVVPAEEPTGVTEAPPGESAEGGAVAEVEDDDLELFRAWLQSLKR